MQNHPSAKDYRNTPIPLFDKLALAFGRDRATGKGAVTPTDVVEKLDKEEEEQHDDDIELLDGTHSTSVNQSQFKRKGDHVES